MRSLTSSGKLWSDGIRRFAVEARNSQAQDYSAIVACFDAMQHDPELAEYQLTELCAARGLDQ
jgi:hypothetical protein